MTLGRALTLVIWSGPVEVAAYQSHWLGTVQIGGRAFTYEQFEASGIFQGHVSGEASSSITMARTPRNFELCVRAMASFGRWLAQLELWEFPSAGAESLPPGSMTRIGITRGQIVKVTNDPIQELRVDLGSSLSPIGSQIPPRTATTALIGPGIRR